MINPILMHPEDVERLCEKSKRIWGAKWRWRKEGNKHGYSWEELEEKLDNAFKRHQAILEKARNNVKRKSNKQLGNESGRDNGIGEAKEVGTIKEKVSATTDSSGTYSDELEYAPVRVSEPIDGSETRSPESPHGPDTSDGSE